MKLNKIKNVVPGEKLEIQGHTSLGIYNNTSTVLGTLVEINNSKYFILSKTKRYSPSIDDLVIGKAIYTHTDFYKIELGFGTFGILPSLSFLNASKRNKPEIKTGDYLFCKIVKNGTEPILSCAFEGLGLLKGKIFDLECYKVRNLYLTGILREIGEKYKYKIALGINGKVWIEGENAEETRDIFCLLKEAPNKL